MANDLWRTPPEVFDTLNKEFNFIADLAASDENHLVKPYYTEKDDSLSIDWAKELFFERELTKSISYAYLNCPYSNPLPWVKKVIQAQQDGLGVVMLLNADDSTQWFHKALEGVSEVRRITGYRQGGKYHNGRLEFIGDNGKPAKGNNKAQFILVFNPFKIGERHTTYVTKKRLMEG